jgi:hypothetical protein
VIEPDHLLIKEKDLLAKEAVEITNILGAIIKKFN